MEKHASLEDNLNAVRWTIQSGLSTVPQVVLGMPGETNSTVQETSEMVATCMTVAPSQSISIVSMTRAQALPGSPLYEFVRSTGQIGQTLEEEEDYLLRVSDCDASDTKSALNFTQAPREVWLSWTLVLMATICHRYKLRFGPEHYYDEQFGAGGRPSLLQLLKNRDLGGLFKAFPEVAYRLRGFLWLRHIPRIARREGIWEGFRALWKNLSYCLRHATGTTRPFEYKSLRKKLDKDLENAYFGTPEMVSLRKGQ